MQTLLLEPHGPVLLIRLNRPEALNALNQQLMRELAETLTQADANPDIRCIVLTGSDKAFAAGADVKEMQSLTYAEVASADLYGPPASILTRIRKPIIAAVSGYCLGGGCELAMLCDFILASDTARFGQPEVNLGIIAGVSGYCLGGGCELAMLADFILASDTARFGQPEVNLGIIAGMGGSQRLTKLIGKSKAMEMHLTGRMMDAVEAERSGLVSRIIPMADLVTEALKTAATIAAKSQLAIKAAKESVNRALETPLSEGLLFERRAFHACFATEDQKEGMQAFLEKRIPQFKDK